VRPGAATADSTTTEAVEPFPVAAGPASAAVNRPLHLIIPYSARLITNVSAERSR